MFAMLAQLRPIEEWLSDERIMAMKVTKEQVAAVVDTIVTMGHLIRMYGEIPSGELYARVMDKMSLTTYTSIIDKLVEMKLITKQNHLLTWIGPVAK